MQCGVGFCDTSTCISHRIHMSPPSWTSLRPSAPSHPSRMSQSLSLCSLSHRANFHWPSILMRASFKLFIEFVAISLLFFYEVFLVLWPQSMWNPSSTNRDWTHTSCMGRQRHSYWTTMEVPRSKIFASGSLGVIASRCSHVWLFVTLWTVAHHAPPSLGLSRQARWSGLPSPAPGDLADPGIEPASLVSPALARVSVVWYILNV